MKLCKLCLILMFSLAFLVQIEVVNSSKIIYPLNIICYNQNNCVKQIFVKTVDKNSEIKINDVICYNPEWKKFKINGFRYVCDTVTQIQDNTYLTNINEIQTEIYWINKRDVAFKMVDNK